MGAITLDLIVFYVVGFLIFSVFYNMKLENWKTSLLLSVMTVYVAREYYEIPIFIAGYLRLANHVFPMLFHHLLVIIIFVFLVALSKFQFTLPRTIILVLTPILISPLLFFRGPGFLYYARIIGISIFGGVFIDGCSLVR